jgi:Protein of unknown function (DUF3223)
MGKRRSIKILNREFGTTELKEYTRQLLYDYEIGDNLSSQDLQFMVALIRQLHPDANEKIGEGIETIWIQENKVNRGTSRGFGFQRQDGSTDNFSYKACFVKCDLLNSHFLMACREAVSILINTYRENAFQGIGELRCPVTGKMMTLRESYVAYLPPSFKELTEAFKKDEGLVISEKLFKTHGDGDFTMRFLDENLSKQWINYHCQYSNLQIRSKTILGRK